MRKHIFRILIAAVLTAALTVPGFAAERETGEEKDGEEFVSVTMSSVKTPVSGGQGTVIERDPDALAGKTISILGDSISTFRNFSNRQGSRWSNTTIGRGRSWGYYSDLKVKLDLSDTWWMQLADDLGLRVLVNNSWSGSAIFGERGKTKGAYLERCVQLHDNTGINDGAEPDIIVIFMGTNDFWIFRKQVGTAEINYDELITQDDNGQTVYREPSTVLEAAAITYDKIARRYPLAEVYVMELPLRADATGEVLEQFKTFNENLAKVAEHAGATLIPLFDGPITAETAERYYIDGRLHPNRLGMDVITEAAKKTILEHTAWKTEPTHTVAFDLDGVEIDYGTAERLVVSGQPFTGKLQPVEAETPFSVEITMDGRDVTADVYKDGSINIDAVTGDVVIRAATNL